MFKPAVTKHVPSKPSNSTTRFIGTSSADTQCPNILKPSPPSSLNISQRLLYSSEKNPLKRTASEVNQTSRPVRKSLGKSSSMGVLSQLHDDLDFDENDFEDDIDLDEDVALPVTYPSLPSKSFNPLDGLSQNTIQYPKLPTASQPVQSEATEITPKKPTSSAPLPWSSSPAVNRMPPPNAHRLRRGNTDEDAIDLTEESPVRPSKRRSLPWAVEGSVEPQTPQNVKPTAASPQLWNKTASAIKQEQNAVRQKNTQHKRAAATKASKQIKDETKTTTKINKGKSKMARVFLSEEQKMVLNLVTEQKQSVFFTGSAGTGKSVLMREIIKALRLKYVREQERVAVTASTGLAACNVSGVTLHSFAGIGLGKEPAEELVKKVKKNNKARSRWIKAKVLIIDEISMVDGRLFDKLEKVARAIRNDGRPFGGIQLVVTGDFFQLPPVPDGGQEATFAFDANTWPTVMQHTIGLTQVFRQKDPAFANMLNEMRVGRLSQKSIETFQTLNRDLTFQDTIVATELFPTRDEVERSNKTRMGNLVGRPFVFDAVDGGTILDIPQRDKMLANCMAPQQLVLKKGAQVMLIKNLDDGLVNGSIGKVIAFMDERKYEVYCEQEGAFLPPEVTGMSQEEYEASRNKIRGIAGKEPARGESKTWPLVEFALQDGTTRQLLCVQEKWNIELPNGEIQASRTQVPLILAWALSIHKAQGQTLDRVRVDLGKVFEKGQAYVALSRATTQGGLQILNFNPKKVMAHDKVRKFYDGLYNVAEAKTTVNKTASVQSSKAVNGLIGDGFDDDSHLLEYANYA